MGPCTSIELLLLEPRQADEEGAFGAHVVVDRSFHECLYSASMSSNVSLQG